MARVCREDDCDTVLSLYNPGPWCAAHEGPHSYRSTVHWATTRVAKDDARRQRDYRARQRQKGTR